MNFLINIVWESNEWNWSKNDDVDINVEVEF